MSGEHSQIARPARITRQMKHKIRSNIGEASRGYHIAEMCSDKTRRAGYERGSSREFQ